MADETIGFGTTLKVNDGNTGTIGGTATLIPRAFDLQPPESPEQEFVDGSYLAMPTKTRPQVPTLRKPGEWSFKVQLTVGGTAETRLRTIDAATAPDATCPTWTITYPDGTEDEVDAWVKKISKENPIDNLRVIMVTLQLNGEVENS